jgi:uncharacterized protein YeaO (DUF488 family)
MNLKRAYDPPSREDGKRILVERLWPRGLSKEKADLDLWVKEIAPSPDLRKWFGHDPEKWPEFKKRYWKELDNHPEQVAQLRKLLSEDSVTLVYGAHDQEHNSAVALKEYLTRSNHI